MTPVSLQELTTYLEKRTQTDWRRMAKLWQLDAADKTARQRLAEMLSNPKIIMPMVTNFTPAAAWILNYHIQVPTTDLSNPLVAAMAHGWEKHRVMDGLTDLVHYGFLLAKEGIPLERFIYGGAEAGRIPEGIRPIQIPPIQEDFQEIHHPSECTLFAAEGERLATALVDLVQFSQHKQLKLTQSRWLAGNQFSAVAKACPTSPVQPIELVEIAMYGGLLKMDGGLKVGHRIDLLKGSVVALLRELWNQIIRFKSGDEPDVHRHHEGLIAPSQARYYLRLIVIGLLGRLKTGHWVSLPQIVSRLLTICPSIGLDSYTAQFSGNHGYQLKYILSFLLYTCRYFGVVEISGPADFLTDWAQINLSDWRTPNAVPDQSFLRITPLGKAILSGEELRTTPVSGGQVILTPDFEIIAPAQGFSEFSHLLGRAAIPLPFSAGDPVRRFRLERERWGKALQGGLNKDDFYGQLEVATRRPLPPNVRATLEGWGENFGRIQLFTDHHLHRFANPLLRDKFIAVTKGAIAVGIQDALAPAAKTPSGAFLIDYDGIPVRCLTFYEDGRVQLHQGRADLLVESEMASLLERDKDGWRLTQKSIVDSGWAPEMLKNWVSCRALGVFPETLLTRLMAWSGGITAPNLLQADILQFADPEDVKMLYHFPGMSQHILGFITLTVLVLKPGRRTQVEEVLNTLNLTYQPKLDLSSLEMMQEAIDRLQLLETMIGNRW